ncbi:MAG: hypothetical protein ACK452_02845 [Bacteroidota bacterium]|jgi:hypothetical protein
MKKLTMILGIVGAIALISCKKDRVCECTEVYGGGSTYTTSVTLTDVTKSAAKANCVSTKSYSTDGVANQYTKTCNLK